MKALVVALLGIAGSCLAQAPAVPTAITEVHTGGWWHSAGKSGTYRVIVVSQGWEHLWSQVFVEWIAEPKSADSPPEVISSKQVGPPLPQGSSVVTAKLLRNKSGEAVVVLEATSNTSPKAKPMRFTFCATEPGSIAACNRKAQ